MNEQVFKDRTKRFALRVIKLVEALPRKQTAQVIGKQVAPLWYLRGCKLSFRVPRKIYA